MATILWLTLLFIFMALSALFESMLLPLLVLLSIPMALTGVVGLFWATDSIFDSSAKIGLVLLFGIVVCTIQAFVFATLTAVYVQMAVAHE